MPSSAGLSVIVQKKYSGFSLELNLNGSELEFSGTTALLGASGAGKSLFLRTLAGLTTPDQGRIVLNGRVLFDSTAKINLPPEQRKIGFLFQNYALFPHLTVSENIAFGLRLRRLSETEIHRRVTEILDTLRIGRLKDHFPRQLSGGQQQRIALARTLITDPEAIFLDEPLSSLDNNLKRQMIKELSDIIRQFAKVVIVVTHNLEEAYRLGNKIAVINHGRLETLDDRDRVFHSPATLATARLTGCRNLSRLEAADAGRLRALDWGNLSLELPGEHSNSNYIGIRDHHIKFTEQPGINTFPCRIVRVEPGPHLVEVSVIAENGSGTATAKNSLWVELCRHKWEDFTQQTSGRQYIQLPPERLFAIDSGKNSEPCFCNQECGCR